MVSDELMPPHEVESAHPDEVCPLLLEGGMPLLSVLTLQSQLKAGKLRAVSSRSPDGVAAIVVLERGDWRQLVAAHGPPTALEVGLGKLRAISTAMVWDEGAVKIDGSRLDALGYRLLVRQSFTQELSRVPVGGPDPSEYRVCGLDEQALPDARRLFGLTHANSIEGLYATLPEAPTLERCEAAFDGYLAGDQGAAVRPACVVVQKGERVVGVICCGETQNEGTAVLLGLAVDPSERGRGLSRVLVRRAQRELKSAGFERMIFLTTDRNTPVHRLFTSEEIVTTETFPARLWLRGPPEPSKAK